jgi:hypothetical protein
LLVVHLDLAGDEIDELNRCRAGENTEHWVLKFHCVQAGLTAATGGLSWVDYSPGRERSKAGLWNLQSCHPHRRRPHVMGSEG